MATQAEKNHNRHLDLLHDYKVRLVRHIEELERMDRQSEFARRWNEAAIMERKEEVAIIDRVLKGLIRF